MEVEMLRIKYTGNEDMIPWDYNGKRYTFSKARPIREYPAEAINWLFRQRDRDWNHITTILPPEEKKEEKFKEEPKPEPKKAANKKKGKKK